MGEEEYALFYYFCVRLLEEFAAEDGVELLKQLFLVGDRE